MPVRPHLMMASLERKNEEALDIVVLNESDATATPLINQDNATNNELPRRIPTPIEWAIMQQSHPWYALAEWESLGSRILWCSVHSMIGDHLKFVLYSSGRIIYRKNSLDKLCGGQLYTIAVDTDVFMSPLGSSGVLDNFVALDKDSYSLPSSRTCHASTIVGTSYKDYNRTVSVRNCHRGLSSYFYGPGRCFHKILDIMMNFDDSKTTPLHMDEWSEVCGYILSSRWQPKLEGEAERTSLSKELIQYYGLVLQTMESTGGDNKMRNI